MKIVSTSIKMPDIDSELDKAAASLYKLHDNLSDSSQSFSADKAEKLKTAIENRAPVGDDDKNQVPLKDSFSTDTKKIIPEEKYVNSVVSSAPHANVIETGWRAGDWSIPTFPSGVAWVPENPEQWSGENGGYYDEETGKVVYSQVDVGYYSGARYIQGAMWNVFYGGQKIDEYTRNAIVGAGYKPGKS